MKKVMFVCMGNICRSPLAHAVFEKIIKREKAEDRYLVDSSGTIEYHVGEKSDRRMRDVAAQYKISINHRAKQLKSHHIEEFDLIVCMDKENQYNALALAKNNAQNQKIVMMRDWDPEGPGDVPDPYYGGDKGFHEVVKLVNRSCEKLFTSLEENP